MKTRKSINYAYPHSPAAKTLGMSGTGCHYVATSVFREGASWSPARSSRWIRHYGTAEHERSRV